MKLVVQTARMSTFAVRRFPPLAVATLAAATMLIGACAAHASTQTERCNYRRYKATATYMACQQKLMASFFARIPTPSGVDLAAVSECRVKYTMDWSELQAKASGRGSICDNTRFEDNGDGTVTDRLTDLQWEKKTHDATVHDVDNLYTWSAGGEGFAAADGTAYTSFLATLNSSGGFAGQCDWRLPTIYELQTILLEAYPCTTSPCIDQAVFGPTVADHYWSATTLATDPTDAWNVLFDPGYAGYSHTGSNYYVRAVRGGL